MDEYDGGGGGRQGALVLFRLGTDRHSPLSAWTQMDRRKRKEKQNLPLALCLNTNMAAVQLLALQSPFFLSANIQMTVCCVFYASSNLINVGARAVTADRGSGLSQAFSLQ